MPGTFGDPLRVVQNLPGVARTPFGLGALVIRGASPNDSGIYVEGHKIPLLYHFLVGPGVLAPELIDRIDFFPGNFGVNYGRVTAGIVDVGIKTDAVAAAARGRRHQPAALGGVHRGAAGREVVGIGLGAAVVRRSAAAARAARQRHDGRARLLGLPGGRATATLPGGRLSLYAFGSNDTLKVVSSDPRQGNLDLGVEIGFHKVFAVWTQALGNWINKLSPAYGYERVRFGVGQFAINEAAHVLALRNDLTRQLNQRLTLRVGLRRRAAHRFDLLQPSAGARHAALRPHGPADRAAHDPARHAGRRRFTRTRPGTWAAASPSSPGVRGDYFRYVGQNRFTFDPRLVVRWKWSERPHLEGGRRHLPPDGGPAAPEPAVRQPEPAADLGGPVFGRVPAPAVADKLTLDTTLYYVRRHDSRYRRRRSSPAARGARTAWS